MQYYPLAPDYPRRLRKFFPPTTGGAMNLDTLCSIVVEWCEACFLCASYPPRSGGLTECRLRGRIGVERENRAGNGNKLDDFFRR